MCKEVDDESGDQSHKEPKNREYLPPPEPPLTISKENRFDPPNHPPIYNQTVHTKIENGDIQDISESSLSNSQEITIEPKPVPPQTPPPQKEKPNNSKSHVNFESSSASRDSMPPQRPSDPNAPKVKKSASRSKTTKGKRPDIDFVQKRDESYSYEYSYTYTDRSDHVSSH